MSEELRSINAADMKALDRLHQIDVSHKSQYAKDMIKKQWQEEVQVSADKWKYMKHTEYKNGIIKNECVGISKVKADSSGHNRKQIIRNTGISQDMLVQAGFIKKSNKKKDD